jgi:predicted ATPase
VAHNLPQDAMPIIGREREIAAVGAMLRTTQVVSIVGAGGIGKTRLAIEAARSLLDEERDGVWFVDLAPISDAQMVPNVIAAAVGLELSNAEDFAEALVATLRNQQILLVLDNCEHIVPVAGAFVEALAGACPQLRILATSREPLGIECESVYRLATLDEQAAMELFAEYAYQADPNFSAAGRNLPVLRDICKRLDGIALAIVLAAANVRVMPLGQLRARLDGRLRLLIAGSRAVMLPRHKTMQALIDWSYDLLSDVERRIFRRLGVFSGTFDRRAAHRVASLDSNEAIDAVLAALVQKSMLLDAGAGRYRMLESIRQYALEHLRREDEETQARRDHAEFFREFAAIVAANFGKGDEEAWLAAAQPEIDNFRAALDWARDNDLAIAAEIAANLADFWEFANLASEGLRRSEVILAALHYPNGPEALPLLLGIARMALAARLCRRSFELAERARSLAEGTKDAAELAEARRISGRSRYLLGIEPERSLWDLHDALDVIRAQGSAFHTARALRDYASALAQKDPEEGRRLLLDALELARTLNWPRLTVHIEINVAEREFRSGNVESAIARARDVIAVLRRRGHPLQLGHALTNIAAYLVTNGELDEALEAAREANEIGRMHDLPDDTAVPLQAAALVVAHRGDFLTAAKLHGYVDAYYERYHTARERTEAMVAERLLELLQRELDPETLERERAAGKALDDDAVAELAFADEEPKFASGA